MNRTIRLKTILKGMGSAVLMSIILWLLTEPYFYDLSVGMSYRNQHYSGPWHIHVMAVFMGICFIPFGVCRLHSDRDLMVKVLIVLFPMLWVLYYYIIWLLIEELVWWRFSAGLLGFVTCVITGRLVLRIYHKSQIRIGQMLKDNKQLSEEDWNLLEMEIRTQYPTFFKQLDQLLPMSDVERRICMLIKVNVPLSCMAEMLCKSQQAVSSIRSRLYEKNFSERGAEKWDYYIRNL